jgi:hypothetical protein
LCRFVSIRGLTTKTLHLESKLRQEYLESKRAKFLTGSDVLSIGALLLCIRCFYCVVIINLWSDILSGDAHIIQELRVANEQLRWSLSQKQQALEAAMKTIDYLRKELTARGNSDTTMDDGSGAEVIL